jgi:hypothetical protein
LGLRAKLYTLIVLIFRRIRDFFTAVEGSLKNHLNIEELARIALTALAAGGGVFGLLEALMKQAGVVFPSASDAALAAIVMTVILEGHRRLGQGEEHLPAARRSRPSRR